jgi:flagellar motor component MotA
MTHEEFVKTYNEIVERAFRSSNKARREGLLALEDDADMEKINDRDIFEYGMQLVIDGTELQTIDGILSNIINQEKDEYMRILKSIQKEAVLSLQQGDNPRILYLKMNSLTDIKFKDDEMRKFLED